MDVNITPHEPAGGSSSGYRRQSRMACRRARDHRSTPLLDSLDKTMVLRPNDHDTRFEAKRVASQRVRFLSGRFDDLPVLNWPRQSAFSPGM